MSNKGIKFFGTNWNNLKFNPTITVSSRDNLKEFAIDGEKSTRWTTDGENTDGNAVSYSIDYGTNRTFDSFYIFNTNIDNIVIQYHNGATWVTITDIMKDSTGYYVYGKLSAPVTAQQVRITGSNTIVANQEKYITLFLVFEEIGQFKYFPDFIPNFSINQSAHVLTDGKYFIIIKGETFSCLLDFSSHVNQDDIDLYTILVDRKQAFWIWVNAGDESIFKYKFKPYRFKDIYKVAIVGEYSPKMTNNYYKSGLNDRLKLVEVP